MRQSVFLGSMLGAMHKALIGSYLVLVASGCATARMALPADVAQASAELAITDRSSWSGSLVDESFGLGPYKVADVDRKWQSSQHRSMGGMASSKTSGGYTFKLASGEVELAGECATENREKTASLGGGWSFGAQVANDFVVGVVSQVVQTNCQGSRCVGRVEVGGRLKQGRHQLPSVVCP